MPANIYLTKQQVEQIAELDEDVVVLEQPTPNGDEGGIIDVWVIDDPHKITVRGSHRSVIIEPNGNVLGDEEVG